MNTNRSESIKANEMNTRHESLKSRLGLPRIIIPALWPALPQPLLIEPDYHITGSECKLGETEEEELVAELVT